MKFILDPALGRLAKWLRIMGYDALYWRGDREGLLRRAQEEGRVILTRTKEILRRAEGMCRVYEVKGDRVEVQLRGLIRDLGLRVRPEAAFGRCLLCNRGLKEVRPNEVIGRVPDYVYRTQGRFWECPSCSRVYWPGTHYERMLEGLRRFLGEDHWRGLQG